MEVGDDPNDEDWDENWYGSEEDSNGEDDVDLDEDWYGSEEDSNGEDDGGFGRGLVWQRGRRQRR